MRLALALACVGMVVVASPSFAEQTCPVHGPIMSRTAIKQLLHREGYTRIRGISRHNGCYEAKGFDAKGRRFELELDASTGAIHNVE